MNDSTAASGFSPSRADSPLRWPPPGLEGMHGALWPVIGLLGVGGALLTLPMLAVLSVPSPFWSPGPLGDAWWLPIVASLVGLAIVVGTLLRGARVLRSAARAAHAGYDSRTIAIVATDAARDAGFLLQELRQYASLGADARRWLLHTRLAAAALLATAVLWVPVAFTAGVVLAARGVFHDVAALWPLLFLPAGVALACGVGARALDAVVSSRLRMTWVKAGAENEQVQRDAMAWLAAREERLGTGWTPAGNRRLPRLAAAALTAVACVLPLPVLTLALVSAVGPLLARIAVPSYSSQAARIARVEVLRPYAVAADPGISAAAAGEAVQVLAYVGRPPKSHGPIERAPVRAYAHSWSEQNAPGSLGRLEVLPARVFERREPLTPEERSYLERLAAHPALAELRLLARAPHADIAGGRWNPDALTGSNLWDLPLPRIGLVREGANVLVATGVLEAERGNRSAAEEAFREVVSIGLLLARNGVSVVDVMLGSGIAQTGAQTLRLFYEAGGRAADGNAIKLALDAVDAVEAASKSLNPRDDNNTLHTVMTVASSTAVPPGLRWESLVTMQTTAGCLNPNAALFGVSAGYAEWLEQTRVSLVRYPSEQALFQLAMNGLVLPAHARQRADVVQRLVGMMFGRRESATTCASLASALAGAL